MLTYRQLQLETLRWIDEASDTDTTLALVKDALNRSHRRLLGERTWSFMRWPGELSFSTTAGTRVYALKHGISKILTLYDQETKSPFPLISRREWESIGVNRVDTQTYPLGAIYGDTWPVAAQPDSAVLTLVSSSSSDTGGPTVVVSGLDASGDRVSETLTATGTSTATGTTSFSHIFSVSKVGTWVGTMTLASGGTTLLSLTSSESAKQYPTIEFIETPSSSRTYLYTAQRTPTELSNDEDLPETPFPYSEIHIYDALLDLTTYNTELGAKEQRLWQTRRDELWNGLTQSIDEGIAGSRPRFVRNLNIGRRFYPRTTA